MSNYQSNQEWNDIVSPRPREINKLWEKKKKQDPNT